MHTHFTINNHLLTLVVPPRTVWKDSQVPKNFGFVSCWLYRGGWPSFPQLNRLQEHYGVTHLVTLQSDAPGESQRITELRQEVTSAMEHHVLTVQDASSFITAAQHIVSLEGTVYVHCSAGANRTGKTILATQVLKQYKSGTAATEAQLLGWLSDALAYGFDYDKPYKKVLEEMLSIFAQQGAITFPGLARKEHDYVFPHHRRSRKVR